MQKLTQNGTKTLKLLKKAEEKLYGNEFDTIL